MVYLEKLFLNVEKTKYFFFHKPRKKYSIPLALPKPYIDNNRIQRSESINFLAVLLDENATLKNHMKCIKMRLQKLLALYLNLGLV